MRQPNQATGEYLGDYLELILDPVIAEDPAALDSQFRGAAADAVLACYTDDGQPSEAYRHHRAVNEAADIYTAALNCAHPHTFPAALAAEEARLKRNAYIRDHYREHTTTVGLLTATAAHLRDLAGKTS